MKPNHRSITILSCLAGLLALFSGGTWAAPMGTGFLYQGRLQDGTNPATGLYDMTFRLFTAATAGSVASSAFGVDAIPVTNGLFSATLDFSATPFDGSARWLEIRVRTNGTSVYIPLSPRQELRPAPYALYAPHAGDAVTATTATSANSVSAANITSGTVPDARLAANVARTSQVWLLGGNVATTPGATFLGTVDNQALEVKVNNARALRIEPNAASANWLAGHSGNSVADASGAVIAGGGSVGLPNTIGASYSSIGGGRNHRIENSLGFSAIGGGDANRIQQDAYSATIAGGAANVIGTNAAQSVIGGGQSHSIGYNAVAATIAGGANNRIAAGALHSSIGGGQNNAISSNALQSVIGGGSQNRLGVHYQNGQPTGSDGGTISGGTWNLIEGWSDPFGDIPVAPARNATIGGGLENSISSGAHGATIGGGAGNLVGPNGASSTVAGGKDNVAATSDATISGGIGNTVQSGAWHGTIGGGTNNLLTQSSPGGTIGGGGGNRITNAAFATIPGGKEARADKYGQQAYASGAFSAPGDAQSSLFVLRGSYTTGSAGEFFLDGVGSRVRVPIGAAWTFDILLTARSEGGLCGSWRVQGGIKNTAGTTSLLGTPLLTVLANDSATFNMSVTANNTEDALAVSVLSGAGGRTRWVASLRTAEVSF